MLFPPFSEPLPAELQEQARAGLDALEALNAYQGLEITCRQVVGFLWAVRDRIPNSPEGQRKITEICDGVEEWLSAEIATLRRSLG